MNYKCNIATTNEVECYAFVGSLWISWSLLIFFNKKNYRNTIKYKIRNGKKSQIIITRGVLFKKITPAMLMPYYYCY